jgi:hypothetical protein
VHLEVGDVDEKVRFHVSMREGKEVSEVGRAGADELAQECQVLLHTHMQRATSFHTVY